ncbi:hypothetical protein GGS26DRAFT_595743 [Hypomontagnella submonticulosa]|nr:hypothetical protein GGS26DRAFT_595743 [Hypomontagnella submonticulosa]
MDSSTVRKFSEEATFGFELEFLVLFREFGVVSSLKLGYRECGLPSHQISEEPCDLVKGGDTDHEVHMKRLHYFGNEIAKKLTEAGTVTVYREKGHPKDTDEVSELSDTEPMLGEFEKFCYNAYMKNTIVPEETMIWTDPKANGGRLDVRPETQDGYFWLGFELVSKAYQFRDLESSRSDLESICRVLRGNYLVSINAGRDSTSRSGRCGTHVHWGLSGREYDLLTVKRVLTLMWVVEERLMELHATWRKDAGKYAALLQKGTNMAADDTTKLPNWVGNLGKGDWMNEMEQNVPSEIWGTPYDNRLKVKWLWRAGTVGDLAMLVGEANKSRRASVGIMELLPATSAFPGMVRRSQLNTIEFRHMQGSLHPTLIVAWIEVTAQIMRRCVDSPPNDFKAFLTRIATCVSETSKVQGLLRELEVVPEMCNIFNDFNQQRLDQEADSGASIFLPKLGLHM